MEAKTKRVYREAEIPQPNPTGLDEAPEVNNPKGDVPGQSKFDQLKEDYSTFKKATELRHKGYDERIGKLEERVFEKYEDEDEDEEETMEEDAEGAGEEKEPEHAPGPDAPRKFPEKKKKKLAESLTHRKTVVAPATYKDKLNVKDAVKEFLK